MTTRHRSLLVLNAGSSSIKFSLLSGRSANTLEPVASGQIDGIGSAPRLMARDPQGRPLAEEHWDPRTPYDALLDALMAWIERHLGPRKLAAAGHRVTHGGSACLAHQRVTADVLSYLQALAPLAPLHQTHNLAPIEALARRHPGLPQVACFDTVFHAGQPRIARMYGLPAALTDEGVWRFGFHGLSYEYIAGELPKWEPRAREGRVIAAHLGSGASLCAMVGGASVASTMGFSTLDGVPMGTRCGALDPGVVLYLMKEKGMDAQALEDLLYRQSGLLGVSGLSGDVRELLASDDARAREAIELFAYRAAREIGSLAAAAGGLDALLFTAGIGERSPQIRQRICEQSAWLGIRLDPQANAAGGPRISAADSPVSVWVLPTDEALMVGRHTFELTRSGPQESAR